MSDILHDWDEQPFPSAEAESWRRNRIRLRIFVAFAVVGIIFSFAFSFVRPAVYESSARILVRPPENLAGESAALLSRRQVAVQKEVMTTGPVIEQLKKALIDWPESGAPGTDESSALLRGLKIEELEDSGVLRLVAEGSEPAWLAITVDSWIESYQSYLDEIQTEAAIETDQEIVGQLDAMARLVTEKRDSLTTFRQANEIVSVERTENSALSRMNGLTVALDEARAAEVNARANLESYQDAAAVGRFVAGSEDTAAFRIMERRVADLREQLRALELKFTAEYIALDPDAQVLVRQLGMAEQELAEARRRATNDAVAEAEREFGQAQRARRQLESDHAAARADASAFTSLFAEHEAMVAELTQLEARQRDLMAEALERDIDRRKDYVELTILERASRPSAPVRPLYWRDAGLGSLAAFGVALLAVALFEFIVRPIAVQRGLLPVPMPYDLRKPPPERLSPPMPTEERLLAAGAQPTEVEDRSGEGQRPGGEEQSETGD